MALGRCYTHGRPEKVLQPLANLSVSRTRENPDYLKKSGFSVRVAAETVGTFLFGNLLAALIAKAAGFAVLNFPVASDAREG
ncbi:hypothetical protein ABE530_06335 [Brucella sp. TWI559]